jgi:hypothetical protein
MKLTHQHKQIGANRRHTLNVVWGLLTTAFAAGCGVVNSTQEKLQGVVDKIEGSTPAYYAGDVFDIDRSDISDFFGQVALILYIIANIYLLVKYIRVKYKMRNPELMRLSRKLFKIHMVTNVAAFGATLVHYYYAEYWNIFLEISLYLLLWLNVAGFMLKGNFAKDKKVKKALRLLHTQQYVTVTLLLLLIIGHMLVS